MTSRSSAAALLSIAPAMPPSAALAYRLPDVPYLRLRFTLAALAPARLPPYKGSMLRGAFGHALRRAVCAMGPAQPCATCPLRAVCVYPRLFESLIEGEPPPFLRGLPTAPRPYVFEPDDEQRDFAPGDPLRFDLLLFGQAVQFAPYARLAVERMADAGLGSGRHRFRLQRAETAGEGSVPGPAPALPDDAEAGAGATLHLLTPLRIKSDSRLETTFSFRRLAFLIVRRTLEIAHFHVPGAALDWTFRPLLDAAGAVRIAHADLRWHDWERYSNRQQTTMRLGGLVGRLRLEGDLAPVTPLLAAAEVLHVGKGATFGLGRVRVEMFDQVG